MSIQELYEVLAANEAEVKNTPATDYTRLAELALHQSLVKSMLIRALEDRLSKKAA